MFGALNRFISRLDSDSPSRETDGHGAFGFQVLRNKNVDIPIEPWYDFIIGINGRQIDDPDPTLFATEVRNCAGSTVTLTLWSAKGQTTRALPIQVPTPSPTLGLTLQWTPLSSTSNIWHILTILPSSPALTAGLLPYSDYILGTPSGIVRGEAGLGELVEDHLSRPLRLYVYNHEFDVTRVVTIVPERGWGGSGALGCVLGFGALHRLPAPLGEAVQAPGETLFEAVAFANDDDDDARRLPSTTSTFVPADANPATTSPRSHHPNNHTTTTTSSSSYLIPANLPSPPPLIPTTATTTSPTPSIPQAAHSRTARKPRHATSPNKAFDEYFKEGEQKSKEEDFVPTSTGKGAGGLPPPPRAGGVGVKEKEKGRDSPARLEWKGEGEGEVERG